MSTNRKFAWFGICPLVIMLLGSIGQAEFRISIGTSSGFAVITGGRAYRHLSTSPAIIHGHYAPPLYYYHQRPPQMRHRPAYRSYFYMPDHGCCGCTGDCFRDHHRDSHSRLAKPHGDNPHRERPDFREAPSRPKRPPVEVVVPGDLFP